MANAISARLLGDDYQYLMFWIQVCRMFDERAKVVSVELEAANVKSLDDVVVRFDPPLDDCGEALSAEYYQVKFHVTHHGAFTCDSLMDPAFINATSVSLLQRIRNAQMSFAPEGTGCRFVIYSPWSVHPDDPLAKLWSQSDGRILVDKLFDAGPRSEIGCVREKWKQHLGLSIDEELRKTLAPLRIRGGPNLDELHMQLNDKLCLVGFVSVAEGAQTHPYCDLCRTFVKKGRVIFTRSEIEAICKREGLWRGSVLFEPEARRLGIRSFVRATEYLEDATDDMLCLVRHFDGRRIRSPSSWETVYLEVESFLKRVTQQQCIYHIHLPSHGTVAFCAGYLLDSKSGVSVAPVQSSLQGRLVWRPDPSATISDAKWLVEDIPGSAGGGELAVAVSITHAVSSDVVQYVRRSQPGVGRILHFHLARTGNTVIRDGTHGFLLAQNLLSEVRDLRTSSEQRRRLRLFWAAPNAFAFFVGQVARGFGPCILYEYDFDSGLPGGYEPSLSVPFYPREGDMALAKE